MYRVLLLNGDPVGLKAMEILLRQARYQVESALSGHLGMELLPEFDPNALLVDLVLQDMSGLDLLRSLRSTKNQCRCILITRFGHNRDREEAVRLGAVDCIEQPLSPELLLTVVYNAVTGDAEGVVSAESYALARWADIVVRSIRAPRDIPTLDAWSREVAVSKGGIRNWCHTAKLSPRRSLQFARILRAVMMQKGSGGAAEDLLDIVDRRTLVKLTQLAGGTSASLPGDVEQFLRRQNIIDNVRAIRTIRAALRLDAHECGPLP